jgi:hypothetical protein
MRLQKAVGDLCLLSRRLNSADRELLDTALVILAEALAADEVAAAEPESDPKRAKFFEMQWQLRDRPVGECQKIICARLKISRATYFRWQADALEDFQSHEVSCT